MPSQDRHREYRRHRSLSAEAQLREAESLELVTALNRRCLEVMVRVAQSDGTHVPAAVSSNRTLWSELHPAALYRAASHPVLLVDINFSDPAWWRGAAKNHVAERSDVAEGYLRKDAASELMRESMTLAWVLVRGDQGLAIALCGMAPSVARIFSSFNSLDVERLAARYHGHLRLRFEDNALYWRAHLKTAITRAAVAPPDGPTLAESCEAGQV